MGTPRHRCNLTLSVDYHQIYVQDPSQCGAEPPNWSDYNAANRAMAGSGFVVINTVRSTDIPVEISIWDSEPTVIFNHWQHVIEAPLTTGGRIEIMECCGESKASFTVEPGDYTVRALYRGLDTVSEDEHQGKDFYQIQIWKSVCSKLRVIRCWDVR